MLRFDVALQALERKLFRKTKIEAPSSPEKEKGVLIPFPLRKVAAGQAVETGAARIGGALRRNLIA